MRRLCSTLLVAGLIAAGTSSNALAHPGGPHFAPPLPPAPPMYRHHHHGPRIGPAIALGLGGLAIGAAIAGQAPVYVAPQPAPVYVAPPPVAVYGGPPPNVIARYYCPPYGQYFPFVRQCPGGWLINPNF